MSYVPPENRLDPGPFREWCEERLRRESPSELRRRLGIGDRTLREWRREHSSLDRIAVEEALHQAGFHIWDVYEEFDEERTRATGHCPACLEDAPTDEAGNCLWCGKPTARHINRPRQIPGTYGKLRDRHIRALHRLHTTGGLSIRELSRRIWERAGYSGPKSAEVTIQRGFKRLGLPVVNRRVNPKPPEDRRCTGPKPNGERCPSWSMLGRDVCWMHAEENRERLSEQARRENARRKLEVAA